MEKVHFNVSANTARLIGRENIANLDGAIIELVKNTYDADAKICILYYEEKTNTLWIIDNGYGMTEEVIKSNWMTIGNSSKSEKYITDSGRIQTGEKGIGRFALDRISTHCKMHTVSDESNFWWEIDWEQFDRSALISSVYAEFSPSNDSALSFFEGINNESFHDLLMDYDFTTGTTFKLTGLRDIWEPSMVSRLRANLAKMLPPDMGAGYKLYFFSDDISSEEAYVKSAFVDTYDYKISFGILPRECLSYKNFILEQYDNEMQLNLITEFETKNQNVNKIDNICLVRLHRNEFEFGKQFDYVMSRAGFSDDDKKYFKGEYITKTLEIDEVLPGVDGADLGYIYSDLYYYKLSSMERDEKRFYYKEFSTRGNKYKEISGIKIYRDNFLVRPYGVFGLNGYDWLDLSTRKAASPAGPAHRNGQWKVHVNQMCGQVHISRLNTTLPDKSSREGLIETREFDLFKELITTIISYLEEDRQYVIRKLNDLYAEENRGAAALEKAKQVISNISVQESASEEKKTGDDKSTYDEKQETYDTFKKAIEYQEEQIEHLEKEMGLLRALATTGILVNTYMHEIKALTTKMNLSIKESLELLVEDRDIEKAIIELEQLRKLKNSFNSWFKVTLEAVQKDKRKMQKHNVNDLIRDAVNSWEEVQENTFKYEIVDDKTISTRCFPYDIESIINNLVANTVSAMKGSTKNPKQIKIRLTKVAEYYLIDYSDNGPGLKKSFKKDPDQILKQGKTNRRNASGKVVGTGMGLWIVNNIVQDYSGYIDLSANKELEEGFNIKIYIKERKERY